MPHPLTAPEYAAVLADGRPRDADVVRAALVDLLARGALRLVPWQPQGRLPERLLTAGRTPEHELPPVLRPARSALHAAVAVTDVDGGPAVRVRDWADGLTHVTEGHGYLDGVVRPALIGAGLTDRVRRRFLPGSRWGLTAQGQAVRDRAAADMARAREAASSAGGGDDVDPRLAAAAVAALGALGAVALADRELVAALVDLRRVAATYGGGGDTGAWLAWDDGRPFDHDPFDGLDGLDGGGLDAVDGGAGADGGWGDGGSSDGGGDGGGGGGGD